MSLEFDFFNLACYFKMRVNVMSSTNTNINIRTGINTHVDFDLVLLAYLFIYEAILLLN